MKTIDFKSFAIGFLLCVVLLFSTGFQHSGKKMRVNSHRIFSGVQKYKEELDDNIVVTTTTGDPFAVTIGEDGMYRVWYKN
jgi:hypothetical protein